MTNHNDTPPGRDQPRTYYKGTIRPFRPRRSTTPLAETKMFCGKKGNVYTVLRAWIYDATVEFPSASINLSLTNGAGSAFTQVSAEEFREMLQTLVTFLNDNISILEQVKARSEIILEQRKKTDEIMSLMRNTNLFPAGTPEEPVEDQYYAEGH